MNLRTFIVAVLAIGVLAVSPLAQVTYMPIEDLRPGMIGVGRTVFAGTKLEDFKVEILGVMRNVIGPKRNLILARLEGGPLAKTGVIAGMSGSPVYIDGKLLGAVSYSLGQFSTEPIAGITPIAEMIDATMMSGTARVARPVALSLNPTPRELMDIWSRDLNRVRGFVDEPSQALVMSGASSDLGRFGAMLRPIAVPMIASGFDASVLEPMSSAFSAAGFVPMSNSQSPGAGASAPSTSPLQPCDAVGVALLTGDFELGATGTVTHVEGDRVYAFGHPLYNLGPTQFPMTRAEVLVVLPSLMSSSKLASLGPVVGTLQQDRSTAVAGQLGATPRLIPLTVTLNSDRLGPRTFSFGVVRDTTFTPLLTYLAVANILTAYERATGPASFSIRGTASIRAQNALEFEDVFTGDQALGTAAAYVAGPLTQLFKNTSEPIDVERIALTIDASEEARSARIERVWLDTPPPPARAAAGVSVALRGPNGEEVVKRVPITIPGNLTGTVHLLVADGVRATADDRRETRGAESQRPSQIIRTFNR